jgi:hypothetical protein
MPYGGRPGKMRDVVIADAGLIALFAAINFAVNSTWVKSSLMLVIYLGDPLFMERPISVLFGNQIVML